MEKSRKDKSPLYMDSNLRIIFLITLMAVLGVASITPAFPRIARDLNIPVQSIGLLITVFTLPGIILTPFLALPVGMVVLFSLKNPEPSDKKGFREYLSSAFQSMKNRKVITYYLASMCTFIGINIPTVQALLAGLAPLEQRAAFMSINGMVLRIGQTLGPIIMGAVFVIWGISGTFITGSIFTVFMVLLMLILI